METIDFSRSEQYTLSIRLRTDGFSFALFDTFGKGEATYLRHNINPLLSLTNNLKEATHSLEWLGTCSFRRVNILTDNNRFTILPLELFEDEQAEQLFHYNLPKQTGEVVQYNILRQSSTVVLFGINKSALHFLHERFPDLKLYAKITPLIDYFTTRSRRGNNRKLYVNLCRSSLELLAFADGHLLLANSFAAKQHTDRIYYILYAWKQLNFDQEHDELHLSGEITDKETLLEPLRTYIRRVAVTAGGEHLDFQAIHTCG
jgi:hypothetical protein